MQSPLLKILYVEDHAESAIAMARLLGARGYYVKVAGSIADAKSAFNAEHFDLLLCDLGLPDGDGCGLLDDLLTHGPLPAIAISGYGMVEDIERSIGAGFLAHLTKPVAMERLLRVLGSIYNELTLQKTSPQLDESGSPLDQGNCFGRTSDFVAVGGN